MRKTRGGLSDEQRASFTRETGELCLTPCVGCLFVIWLATTYESVGRKFESSRARFLSLLIQRLSSLVLSGREERRIHVCTMWE